MIWVMDIAAVIIVVYCLINSQLLLVRLNGKTEVWEWKPLDLWIFHDCNNSDNLLIIAFS